MTRQVMFRCALALLLAIGLAPASARAQGAGGSITGVVKDESGLVLPGVTIEVTGGALLAPRAATSDGSGQYRVVGLGPGSYTVTFTLTGFSTFKRDGVEIAGDFTATINGDMKVGSLEETITVSGEAPIVDVQNVQRQRVMTAETVEAVPTGKYFVNLGVLIPGVSASCSAACQGGSSQDTGGGSGDSMATLIVHGSRFRDQRISINNMTVRGATGYLGVTGPNVEAQQETQIDTSGADTSVGTGGVRINVVPKDGGNKLSGGIFMSGTNEHFQGTNITQELKDRGLAAVGGVKTVYDVAPTLGGPIMKDKLFFFASVRKNDAQNYAANVFQNLNRNQPNVWAYAADLNTPGVTTNPLPMAGLRLTYQANAKNKFAASFDYRDRCQCTNLGNGGNFGLSPDAAVDFRFRPQQIAMATWSAPLTNKLLLEATGVALVEGWGNRVSETAGDPSMVRVQAINAPQNWYGIQTYRGAMGNTNWTRYPYRNLGLNATYVTGAHAFKAGVEFDWGINDRRLTQNLATPVVSPLFGPLQVTNYQVNMASGSPVPNQVTFNLDPTRVRDRAKADGGLYLQDKYTFKRVTVAGGLRFDFFTRVTDDVTHGPNVMQPTRNLTIPGQTVVSYKDLSPRLGVAYDIFGNGKTAVKVSLNRYVQDLSLLANNLYSAQQNYVRTAARQWTDSNGNFIPDCDPLNTASQNNTARGGDICGAYTGNAANFGTSASASVQDSNVVRGFNNRGYNWEFAASVQQEIVPRKIAIDVGYFRRWYGNFTVTDNPLTTAANYDSYSIVVPTTDSRLPTAGQTISGFTNIQTAFNVATTNQDRLSSNYGTQKEYWHGMDISGNYRIGGGATLQGGVSFGKQVIDACEVVAKVPEMVVPSVSLTGATGTVTGGLGVPYCRNAQPWLTQIKGMGTYTVPKLGITLSGTYQDTPGPQLGANWAAPNSAIQASLGRLPTGGTATGTTTIPILAPGALYGDRLRQLDFRIGKAFRFKNGRRITPSIDLYNATNSSTVLTENANFSTANTSLWRTPQLVQQPRMIKFTIAAYF